LKAMWPRRDLINLLMVGHPIVQAPISGLAPTELVIAVVNAGGLGSLGCAGQPLDIIRSQVQAIYAGTDRPFSMNFLPKSRHSPEPEQPTAPFLLIGRGSADARHVSPKGS
jgi:NAD(P)H-dependent flavin oxidoreductase YrpB (nitropropane dioxygenase family)